MAKKINSNRKGKSGERAWAAYLREWGFKARRGQQFSGSPDSPDVVHNLDGLHFEVKRVERLNIYDAMDQAVDDAGEGEIPVVAHRRNGRYWMVTMRAEDFLTLAPRIWPKEG